MSIFGDLGVDPDDLEEKSDLSSEKDEWEEEEMKMSSTTEKLSLKRSQSVPSWQTKQKVDKVYTVGCFDLFHEGHKILLERLRELGTQVRLGDWTRFLLKLAIITLCI